MQGLRSAAWRLGFLAILTLAPQYVSAMGAQGLSSRGSGLITLPDTRILPKGQVALGLGIDNRDRDPLGLDLLDGYVYWTAGLTDSVELYGRYVFSRVAALPEQPAQPPPPLDLIVPSSTVVPPRPFYSLNTRVPYVDGLGANRFGEFVQGGVVIGSKIRIRSGGGLQPALAIAADLDIPTGRSYDDLRSGSGTGSVDLSARIAGEWARRSWDLVVGTGFTWTGNGQLSDRILVVGDGLVEVIDQELRLPHLLDFGIGARWRISSGVALVTEVTTDQRIGLGTPIVDTTAPVDLLAGVQLSFGRARMTVAARYHANALESGAPRTPSLAGGVVLTGVSPNDISAYLQSQGLGGAVDRLRPESHKVVVQPVPGALPSGARLVPSEYSVRSEHQIGFVILVGWHFDRWPL